MTDFSFWVNYPFIYQPYGFYRSIFHHLITLGRCFKLNISLSIEKNNVFFLLSEPDCYIPHIHFTTR